MMRRAVALSRRGYPAPNPHVGCVIAKGEEVVAEGWHAVAGDAHAEAVALALAGERARGATAYVTLAPCGHHGRTPPCADALISAGVGRVVVATEDPNPVAAGGIAKLRAAGVRVDVGIQAAAASAANEVFLISHQLGRPFITLKAAMTLDGRIASPSGDRIWITGEAARQEGRRLRAAMGSVLVGWRTVQADNPQLTARMPELKNEIHRILLDPHRRLSGAEAVFQGNPEPIWIDRPFQLCELVRELFVRGIRGVLVEGGAATLTSFLREGLWDRLELFVAPKVLGAGLAWVDTEVPFRLEDQIGWIDGHRTIGSDLWITIRPSARNEGAAGASLRAGTP